MLANVTLSWNALLLINVPIYQVLRVPSLPGRCCQPLPYVTRLPENRNLPSSLARIVPASLLPVLSPQT